MLRLGVGVPLVVPPIQDVQKVLVAVVQPATEAGVEGHESSP
jgi:hypothetical protein